MNNMNFTDWQDLWLKKDVEKIAKNMDSTIDFSVSVIVNLIIVTITLAITAISVINQEQGLIPAIVILAILSLIAPLLIIGIFRFMKHKKTIKSIISRKMPTKEYVDIFDNKICNSAMMADSLFEHMKDETDFPAKYYCICEINYFINICIDELSAMKNMCGQVFKDDVVNCVSPKRLRLVIKLLHTLRVQTYDEMKNKIAPNHKDLVVEAYINNEID